MHYKFSRNCHCVSKGENPGHISKKICPYYGDDKYCRICLDTGQMNEQCTLMLLDERKVI